MCRYRWDKYKCPFCQQSTSSPPTIRHKSDICRYAKRRHQRHVCRTLRAGGTQEEARHVTYKFSPDRTILLASGKPCGSSRCKELVQEAQWQEMVRRWWAGQAKREGRTGVERWREDVAVNETIRVWEKGQVERRRKARMDRWRMGCETISEETLGPEGGGHGADAGAGEGYQSQQENNNSSSSSSSSSQRGPRIGGTRSATSASRVANGVYTPQRAPTRAPSDASVVSASRPPVRSTAPPSSVASSSGHSSSYQSASGSVFSRGSAPSSVSSTASYTTSRTRGSGSVSMVGGARGGRTDQKSSSSSRSSAASSATWSNKSTSKALVLWNRGKTQPVEASKSTSTSRRIPFPTKLFPRRRPVPPNSSAAAASAGPTRLTSQALILYNKNHPPPGSVTTSAAATLATAPSTSQTSQTYPPSSRRTYTTPCRRPAPLINTGTATSLRVHPPQSTSSSSSVVSSSMVSLNSGENYLDRSNRARQQRRYGGSSTTASSEDARSYRSVSPMSSISNRPEGCSEEGGTRRPLRSDRGLGGVNPLRRLLGLRGKVRTR